MIGLTNSQNYKDIANAIRSKGATGTFKPSEMAAAIRSLGGDEVVFNYGADICALFSDASGAWGDVGEFDTLNHAYIAMQLEKDYIIKFSVKDNFTGEQDIVKIYAGSENFYNKIRVSNGHLQTKIQFGGDDVIQWTNINFDSEIEIRYLQGTGTAGRKLEIYEDGSKIAEYTPDSDLNRRPWNNNGATFYRCAPQYLNSFEAGFRI